MPPSPDRVLLIDDDPNVLTALKRLLRGRFDIGTATGGAMAIELVQQALHGPDRYSVAVCDMHMPMMDGIETLKRVKAIDPMLVGIMLTGDADQNIAINALNSGNIFRFYSKPFNSALLSDGIAAALHQNQLLHAETLLAQNEERWRLALEAVGDGVWDWDVLSSTAFFSHGWWNMLGEADQPGASAIDQWWSRIHPDDRVQTQTHMGQLLDGRCQTVNTEHRLLCQDGSYRWFMVRGTALFRDEDGHALRIIGTHADISSRRAMEDLLRQQARELTVLATTDPLTGLLNRRCFLERAEAELLRTYRYQRPMAIIMVDIDFFKKVNDTHGHAAGDIVLRRVTDILGTNLRSTDSLGRLGGEEFAVLLPESTWNAASIAAEALRKKVAEEIITLSCGTQLHVTASFGLAVSLPQNDSVNDILNRADQALYQAKQTGRNRVVCYASEAG